MAQVFTQWLHAVIYTGIVCALALLLTPEGRVKMALKIICAVVMCVSIASPAAELDFSAYSKAMAKYKLDAQAIAEEGEQYSKNLNRSIIEDECRAYILDKANEVGTEVSDVTVTAVWSIEGYWYPKQVSIASHADEKQREQLSDWIQAQLGISINEQEWSNGENDG